MASFSEKSSVRRVSSDSGSDPMTTEIEHTILRALRGLRFGQITINVQEGRVTQVDRSEHTRHFRDRLTHQ
jgi:hypothetical protein